MAGKLIMDVEVQVSLPLEGNKNGTAMQDSSTFKNASVPIIIILSYVSPFRLVLIDQRFFGFINVSGMITFMVLGFEGVLIHN